MPHVAQAGIAAEFVVDQLLPDPAVTTKGEVTLKPVAERCSVVLAGAWNQAIFTVEWVQSVLFAGAAPEVEMVFGVGQVLTFTADNTKFRVLPSQALVGPTTFSLEALQAVETVSLRLLRRLPETPLRGVGINFGFDITEPNSSLQALFQLADSKRLVESKVEIQNCAIARRLRYAGRTVNVVVSRSADGDIRLDANHHYDVGVSSEAVTKLMGDVLRAHDLSLTLIRDLYGLEEVVS